MLVTSQVENKQIANVIDGLPSLNLIELSKVMRIDSSLGEIRLETFIIDAMDTINGELESFIESTVLHLPPIELTPKQTRTYKRALMHEACALMTDQYVDFDTASSSRMREEKQHEIVDKSQRMRRIVNHCIADLTGRPRNRIKLV